MILNTITTANSFPGEAIDTATFESLEYIINFGTIVSIGGGISFDLEESDTGLFAGEETSVPADEQLGGPLVIAAVDDDKAFRLGSVGKKRYQRIVMTTLGTPNFSLGISALLAHAHHQPSPDQNT